MQARPIRRSRIVGSTVATLVAVAAALAGAAVPATAAPSSSVAKYVALGDSYAAGQGAGIPLDSCLRSTASYPTLLDQPSVINLLRQPACSGATIADVASTQVASTNRGTTLVTVTAGGNDLPIGAAFAVCVPAPTSAECAAVVAQVEAILASNSIRDGMRGLVLAISSSAPRAHIVVTDYPVPFVPGLSDTTDYVNGVVARLDQQIGAGVALAVGAGADAEFVSMATAFVGHQIGNEDSWLGDDPSNPISFLHPTVAGQDAYRDAVLAALSS
jgi:lysophospholipase L1-like esterase